MPSLARRAYTSYDGYGDYNSEDLLNEMYPVDGTYTPQPYDGRATPLNDRMSPLNGLQNNGRCSPGRPTSRMRTPGRAKSRQEVTVQEDPVSRPNTATTEAKLRPMPNETQRNFSIPEATHRATTPVQKLLNRSHTQQYMNMQGNLPGTSMDPFTMQYYHRMWKNQAPSRELSLNRQGRAGGQWRHVRACVANTGTQLAFIDGTVKEEDNVYFPPFATSRQQANYTNYAEMPMPNYMMPTQRSAVRRSSPSSGVRRNKFNNHAKAGLKYWYQEPKPIDCGDCGIINTDYDMIWDD